MTDWDKGFDAYFESADAFVEYVRHDGSSDWMQGWLCAGSYQAAIKARKASPRDSEISDLEELIR